MTNADTLLQQQLAAIPAQESLVGTFVSQSGADAIVDQGTSRLTVRAATQVPCRPGDPVRLEWRGGQLILVGPANPRATLGKVTVAGNPATVEYPPGSGRTAALPVAAGLTVAVNDNVVLEWGSGGTVIAKVASPSSPTPPTPPAGGGSTQLTQTFTAIDSGSFDTRWWTREVYSSASNVGAYFYGGKIKDTIPDTATIQSASIWLPLRQNSGGNPTLALHTSATRPGGTVAFTASTVLTGARSGQLTLPTSWLDVLKANDGGIGFNHGGYNIYRSIDSDGNAGAITVTYVF